MLYFLSVIVTTGWNLSMMFDQKMSGILLLFSAADKTAFFSPCAGGLSQRAVSRYYHARFLFNIKALIMYKHAYVIVVFIWDVLKCCFPNPSTTITSNALKWKSSKVCCAVGIKCLRVIVERLWLGKKCSRVSHYTDSSFVGNMRGTFHMIFFSQLIFFASTAFEHCVAV